MPNHLPAFLVKKVPKQRNIRALRDLIADDRVRTVCEEAKCPNIGECYSQHTCTFMILGDICSRRCAFCGVGKGTPPPLDPDEPARIAAAAQKLGLNYLVITSVTRDDLPDGGAGQFAAVIRELKSQKSKIKIEVLIPDFKGDIGALRTVMEAKPDVLNHNIETVPRLYPTVRPQADYRRSLELLANAKVLDSSIYTKSGFMVGLGEEKEEVASVLKDLRSAGCDMVTIGQYLPPSRAHLQPARYVSPAEFKEFEDLGRNLGFLQINSGPFVRSSYHAQELASSCGQ